MTDLKTLRDKLNGSLMMAPDENEEMLREGMESSACGTGSVES